MSDRLALIIANSEFDDSKLSRLRTPCRDAEVLSRVLGDPAIGGFDVTLLVNETEPVMRRQIARLYHRRKRDDLLLLYYSGHGIRDEHSGKLYLATSDTEMDIASATALDAAFVRGQIDRSDSQRKVVVLDCCHSGAFAGAMAALGSSANTQEAFAGKGYGRVILTSSNALEFAWEGDELLGEAETSVFTRFLVEGLQTGAADRDGDGKVSLDELYDYVHDQVIANSKQTPQKWALKVEGQIIIAQNPHLIVKPAELPPDLQQAIKNRLASVREAAVTELEYLLHGSDQGLALAAQEALTHLADDDSRRVSAAAANALGTSPVAVTDRPPAPLAPTIKKPKPKPEPELHPSLTLKLSAKPQIVEVGGEIKWTVTLRNDGDDDLHQVTVRHARRPLADPFALAAGKGRRFTFVTIYDAKGKKTENVTTVGVASNGQSVHDEASASVQVREKVRPTPPQRETAQYRVLGPDRIIWEQDGKEMVRVPAGKFLYGDEKEERELPEFWIDKTPVTNAEYKRFLDANPKRSVPFEDEGWARPYNWDRKSRSFPQDKADHPVVLVSCHDAVAYAEWAGKRLPIGEEWEKAARGTDGRKYPWGDEEPTSDLCNFGGNEGSTTPVGKYSPQGDSLYGCVDMAGNVWEWTASDYDKGRKVLRGGSWFNLPNYMRAANRDWIDPVNRYSDRGFRCARGSE